MLQSNGLKGRISAKESITAKLNNKEVQVYPELEDLTVTPSAEEQYFKSEKYGYDNITVKAVESEELNIIPNSTEQVKEGIFNKVTVEGDSDLIPENIKEGAEIFGVEGVAKTTNIKITDTRYLFYGDSRINYLNEFLELCSDITNVSYMFTSCNKLKNLNLSSFNTSQVTNMSYMFNFCNNLINLDLSSLDTSKVTTMDYMFYYCNSLTNLNLNNLDMSKINSITVIFYSCSQLTNLQFGSNLGKGYTKKSNNYGNYRLDLSFCTKLTHESLMSVINNLYDLNLTYDVANGGTLYTQSLVLGATNLAKLTSEEIAIATSKGWNVT